MKVILEMTMTLDGYITGPKDSVDLPLGENGERIHKWVYDLESWRSAHGMEGGRTDRENEMYEKSLNCTGAVIIGRRMYNHGEPWWGENPPFHKPVFVLTHEKRGPQVMKGGTSYTFIRDGIESALRQAKAAAGDKNVSVSGGADTARQFLKAGLVDELHLHITHVLLGGGRRLFDQDGLGIIELEQINSFTESADVTHLQFRVKS